MASSKISSVSNNFLSEPEIVTKLDENSKIVTTKTGKTIFKCKHCNNRLGDASKILNVTRAKFHLKKCIESPFHEEEIPLKKPKHENISSNNFILSNNIESLSSLSSANFEKEKGFMNRFVDKITDNELKEINDSLGKFIISTGSSFNIVENDHFRDLIRKLRPSYYPHLPHKDFVSNSLLDNIYDNVKKEVDDILNSSSLGYKTLSSDGWINNKGEHILNIMSSSYNNCFFLDSLNTQEEKVTATYISEILSRYIEIDPTNYCCICSDNASVALKGSRIAAEKYPKIFSIGDLCHILDLCCSDIASTFKTHLETASGIIKSIKNNSRLLSSFNDLKKINKTLSLKIPPSTRFYYIYTMIHSLIINKTVLFSLLSKSDTDDHIKSFSEKYSTYITDAAFWKTNELIEQLFEPLADCIVKLEKEILIISDIYPSLFFTFNSIQSIIATMSCESESTKSSLHQKLAIRWGSEYSNKVAVYNPIYIISYVLNPFRYFSDNFPNDSAVKKSLPLNIIMDSFSQLISIIFNSSNEQQIVQKGFVDYLNREGIFNKSSLYLWSFLNNNESNYSLHDILSWWSICSSDLLREFAKRILSIQATSVNVERSFSIQKNIHSLYRNRMGDLKVKKLLFCNINLRKLLNKSNKSLDIKFDEQESESQMCLN